MKGLALIFFWCKLNRMTRQCTREIPLWVVGPIGTKMEGLKVISKITPQF